MPNSIANNDDNIENLTVDNTHSKVKCDIYEKDSLYNIDIDLPGYEKKNIVIEVNGGKLIVTADMKQVDVDVKYLRRERNTDKCQVSFKLANVNYSEVNARYKNGVLKIVIPKKDNNKDRKVIAIK